MAESGFCNVCYGRVWVTHEGGCARGHAPYAVSDVRETDPNAADAPAGPPPAFFDPGDEAPVPVIPPLEDAEDPGDGIVPLELPEIEWVAAEPAEPTLEGPEPLVSGPDAFFGSEADDGGLPPARPASSEDTLLEPQIPERAVKRAQQLGQLAPLAVFGVCTLCYLLDTCARL